LQFKLKWYEIKFKFSHFGGRSFGSCHSFGVAEGLRGYGMCQMLGKSKQNLLKNAKGRLY
jgi:hypothetical protein